MARCESFRPLSKTAPWRLQEILLHALRSTDQVCPQSTFRYPAGTGKAAIFPGMPANSQTCNGNSDCCSYPRFHGVGNKGASGNPKLTEPTVRSASLVEQRRFEPPVLFGLFPL